ncbi:Ig-like domain-containing protein [Pseudomonas sp. SWRI153]|uniref:Ig-like domain-containing protein n=1 Tax=Pseudomonas khorasanensis TaxID=2745508 RepID=A0A923F4D4_9PSED|nr:Ig-like domain-containing protein [Pseudomonas khorasanensis]MBV4484224.1 Ig-like domain-containing protein [Pseudomonas khorasanensis]
MDTRSTINIQSDELIEIFKLFPVFVPGWVTLVKPSSLAHGGVPRRLFTGAPKRLLCVVDPWIELLNRGVEPMAAYDSVELFINGETTPVDSHTVQPGTEKDRVALHVSQVKFVNGVNKLQYVVERPGGNKEPSDVLLVLHHLHPHANVELIIPPEVLANGVTAELAKKGIKFEMSYTTKEPFEVVELKVGNATFKVEVTDPSAPASVTLYTADFEDLVDGEVTVNFLVTDQLGNYGDSPDEKLNIRLKEEDLPAPTLTNVLDANNNEVPHGDSTTSTTLILKGTASKGKEVEIFDGSGSSAVSKGGATASLIEGSWEHTITVPFGRRRLYAQSLYHPTPVYSTVRILTVTPQQLSIDTTQMVLDGVMVRSGYCPNLNSVDAIGNTQIRAAAGGTPPYTYRSSNASIAAVDASGKVTGMGNGGTTITITDQQAAQVSYSVKVTNIYSLLVHGGLGWNYQRYLQSLAQRGEVHLTPQIRAVMQRCFFQPWFAWVASPKYPLLDKAWTGNTNGPSAEVYNTYTRHFEWLAPSADPHDGLSFSMTYAGGLGAMSGGEKNLEVAEMSGPLSSTD